MSAAAVPVAAAAAEPRLRLLALADDAARRRLIETHPAAALVSQSLPLRANLDVLENIAVVPRYQHNLAGEAALDQAWELLELAGHSDCAELRDADLSFEQRFVAKLLRALIGRPELILIDRPALLLPDSPYPQVLRDLLARLDRRLGRCWILDYAWNAPLHPVITFPT